MQQIKSAATGSIQSTTSKLFQNEMHTKNSRNNWVSETDRQREREENCELYVNI